MRILVVDRSESLGNQVRQTGADVVSCTRTGELPDVFAADGPFDLVIAGPSLMNRTGLRRLERLSDDQPDTPIVLVSSPAPDVHMRDIVRTGAVDLLATPVRSDDLAGAVERAVARHRRLTAGVTANHPVAPGTTFTVSSATGGCGKTFYATNLAYFLAHHTGRRVCIADFDLQFGEVTTALRLRPKVTSFDLVERVGADELDDCVEEYLVPHETGVWVLPAPKDPVEAERITPADVSRIIDALRRRFDYVIVDTPAQLSEVVLAAFDRSDVLFTMATLDLPSVRNMGVFLNTLQRLRIPAENIRLILNKAESDVGIELEQVTRLFPQGFSSVLPYAKEVSRSINLGMPVLAATPAAPVSRQLAAGMAALLPEGERPDVDTSEPRRRFPFLKRSA